ncbi:MAG: PorT family protein [Chitinophagales bacterium]|nr:PorT family protein [Chitinophagales bacterium]
MSNRFDDIIKDKLSKFKASYDPSDWSAMEELLDKPGNKVGGAWIWNLSTIGLILIGALTAAGFLYSDNHTFQHSAQHNGLIQESEIGMGLRSQEPALFDCNENFLIYEAECDETVNKPLAAVDKLSNTRSYTKTNIPKTIKINSSTRKVHQEDLNIIPGNNSDFNSSVGLVSDEIEEMNLFAIVEENEIEFTSRRKRNSWNFKHLKPFDPYEHLLIESEERALRFEIGDHYAKIDNKWNYNLGLSGGTSLSYLDDNLMPRFGYNIGLGMEAMFKGKFGVSTGLNYSVIEYETSIFDCDTATRYRCPVYYTSIIKSVDIPISIRYNLVRKNSWRLFLKGGITNHIKLEEKFNYIFEPDNSEPQPPRSNNFTHNSATSSLERSFDRDFTLSEEKRYHMSYMAGFGVEKFVARQMSLGFGPDIFMTANKAGNKDNRIVTFRASGSLKFYPGR